MPYKYTYEWGIDKALLESTINDHANYGDRLHSVLNNGSETYTLIFEEIVFDPDLLAMVKGNFETWGSHSFR